MFEQSRRSFIKLGALAAASPAFTDWIPVSRVLEANTVTSQSFVTIRGRLLAERDGSTVIGEHAQVIPFAWARYDGLTSHDVAVAQVALHDSMRELMEGVPSSNPIGLRERPESYIAWYLQLFFTSWTPQGIDEAAVVKAENSVFAALDRDATFFRTRSFYGKAARQRLEEAASSLGVDVHVETPFILRVDSPHSYKWTSARPELTIADSAAATIAANLSQTFMLRFGEYLTRRPERFARIVQTAAAAINEVERLKASEEHGWYLELARSQQ